MIEVLYTKSAAYSVNPKDASNLGARGFTVLQRPAPALSRAEHRMKELGLARGGKQAPRRSQTQHNYHVPPPPSFTLHTARHDADDHSDNSSVSSADDQPQLSQQQRSEAAVLLPAAVSAIKEEQASAQPPQGGEVARGRRPLLGAPRRSYSVMDCEPVPQFHRLSERLQLLDLPSELHFAIFDFLDPIDSTCLGLTNKHFYDIHKRMHGKVRLGARRDGPNELEWAWHLAGAIVQKSGSGAGSVVVVPSPSSFPTSSAAHDHAAAAAADLSRLRVRGQAYCRKCGVTRCELHKHVQEWFGPDAEYCSVSQKFGHPAQEGARPYCYMSKPGNTSRCGRHHVKRMTVALR